MGQGLEIVLKGLVAIRMSTLLRENGFLVSLALDGRGAV